MATKLGRFHSLKASNDDSGGETCTSFLHRSKHLGKLNTLMMLKEIMFLTAS